jgi:Tfp pilus assembly protein PilF
MSMRELNTQTGRLGRPLRSKVFNYHSSTTSIAEIYAAATSYYQHREFLPAENLCRAILARDPDHLRSRVLLADLVQQSGRNKLAVKMLKQALALDCSDAAAHDTIAIAYQALGRRDDAVRHFAQAVALGLGGAEMLIKQSAAVAAPLKRLAVA